MTLLSTTIRATHLVTNAAWFGGSLRGAVGLNPAARRGDADTSEVAGTGWERWGPVQGVAIGAHLLTGLGIVADNRRRVLLHPPTTTAVVLKTTLTGVALGSTAWAWQAGRRLSDTAPAESAQHARDRTAISWLQWVTPAATGALLVLDAYLGEQQRGLAGRLDPPMGS
ncbi:hypothetical protein [Flexivirga sp.]|uniref:hypothetical protein n=1 Tax=Flexivirga sp. TaxID=1962927 RepID=UPI003F7E7CAB